MPRSNRAALLAAVFIISAFAQAQTAPQFTISTVAGTGTAGYSGDSGPALKAEMNDPRGVALDAAGNLYIADYLNNRVRKVSAAGTMTTLAGNGTQGFSGDGGPATAAALYLPIRVSVDLNGNVYIADTGNQRVRKVTSAGIISTVAGNGSSSASGDGGPATGASIGGVNDAEPDANGNLFISEQTYVRKVDANGIITTIAGNGTFGYGGDNGPATQGILNNANSLTVGSNGILFVSDQFNYRVRKIANGIITTVAGNGVEGYSGDNGTATAAKLGGSTGMGIAASGVLFIADNGNNRIRAVLPSGIIVTVAGNGVAGFAGDGGPATSAEIILPKTIALTPSGGFYFADDGNN